MTAKFKFGLVAVVGRPNAGKSTLVNRLVGQKVAIVTSRPQTTRNRIQGIVNSSAAQIVLVDTPGLHRPDSALGRQMMGEVTAALEGVDVLVLVVDVTEGFGESDRRTIDRVARFDGIRILLLNKVDRVSKDRLLPLMDFAGKCGLFTEVVPISALTGNGVDRVMKVLVSHLPAGEARFPEDQYTDQPERFLAAEIIREKAMERTKQEVPHAVGVLVESFEEAAKLIRIRATIYVEREGQKGILIGRSGATLKLIGTAARKELEDILGIKIFLELYVKVRENWRDNGQLVKQMDWRSQLDHLAGE